MSRRDLDVQVLAAESAALNPLLDARPVNLALAALPGVTLGDLVALTDEGRTPLVVHPTRPGSALRARTTVDLHAAHIGKQVVLVFEHGDLERPIVVGVLRQGESSPTEPAIGQVEIDADGERLLVTAQKQMVLRCGKASITLTKAGKVMIEGTYLSSRSTGINRIKGGSVQLN